MSKAIIYAGNSAIQATTVNGTTVQFPNIVRRYGCNLGVSGGNVSINGTGYYEGTVNLTVTGTEAGTLVIQIYKDGVAVPYASASIVTTAGSDISISIPFVCRQTCCCESGVISVIASGVASNITNAGIVVEKE